MFDTSEWNINDTMNWIFRCVTVLLLIYLVWGQVALPVEGEIGKIDAEVIDLDWEMVLSEGQRERIEVPGEYPVPRGQDFVVETILPEEIDNLDWLCFRSSQQDMDIYIDGELRTQYTTKDSKPFGKTSASAFVFVNVLEKDEGKVLRLVTRSDSAYSGMMNEVYIGDRLSIWLSQWKEQGYKLLIAIVLIVLSIVSILVSMILRIGYKKRIVLEYLGWGIFFSALWIIGDSKLRQLFFYNYSVLASLGFIAIMLIPLPFFIYINELQNGRYRKWYMVMTGVSMLNFLVCMGLQLSNLVDFLESMIAMHIVLGVSVLLIGITLLIDLSRHLIRDYVLVAIGMLGILVSACVEILIIYQKENPASGIALCIGLLVLLVMAVLTTGQDIMQMEREKQRAVVSGEAKLMFLANMSHEIRTPINTIIGMNEVIMRENQNENIQEYLYNIQNASKMLLALVNDVLDFSKIDTGNIELENYPYYPASMLNDLVHMLEAKASKKNLEVHLHISKELPSMLEGDEIRVKQIITNLLTNAVKYTNEGSITFTVTGIWSETGEFALKARVSDTGIGIKEEDLERLFVRFARLDQDRNRNIEGTGLGLSITKLLVDEMKGDIRVDSEYGEGSTFTVILPQKVVDVGPMGDLVKAYKKEIDEDKNPKEHIYIPSAKILVVDDNKMNLTVVKALLKDAGISIDTAMSGQEGLELCKEKKYDLILMDHMMPGMDGIETLHLLRKDKDGVNQQTKVIALTANAISGSREKYISEGFDDYISKPIEVSELEAIFVKHLENLEITYIEHKNNNIKNNSEKETNNMTEEQVKNLTYIDQETGLQFCAESREVYIEMLEIYLEQGEENMTKLPALVEQKDWKNYIITVHGLKGTSMTIGAQAFSEKAKEQEFAGKEERYAFIEDGFGEFMELYKKMLEAVRTIIDNE